MEALRYTPTHAASAKLPNVGNRTLDYRPAIDGIRAVAVVAVILYHLDPHILTGGFIAVDLFYVISGFLITRIIVRDMHMRNFSLRVFIVRRFRRIFPALLATVAITFIVACFVMPPPDLKRTAVSAAAAVLSVSNLYFWHSAGYFDADAITKPLLHTWSLGVEEQFYLIWPLLMLAVWRLFGKRFGTTMAVLFVTSLLASQFVLINHPNAAFYLMPLRIFEFAIGAGLAVVAVPAATRLTANLAYLAGISLIVGPVILYTTATPFPGFAVVLPCVGAALLIWGADASDLAVILSNRPTRFVGKISYSLYLVHFPVVVLFRFMHAGPLTGLDMVGLAAVTFVLGLALYYSVERPFRQGLIGKRFSWRPAGLAITAVLVIPLLAATSLTYLRNGWPERLPPELRNIIAPVASQQEDYWANAYEADKPFSGTGTSVYVIGNSFAVDTYYSLKDIPGLDPRIDGTSGYQCYALHRLLPGYQLDCERNFGYLASNMHARTADVIVIHERWAPEVPPEEYSRQLTTAIDHLRSINPHARLVIIGPRATYNERPVYERVLEYGKLQGVNQYLAGFYAVPFERMQQIDDWLRGFSDSHGVSYVSPLQLMCKNQICPVVTPTGKIIYWDGAHWTLDGDQYFAQLLIDSGVAGKVFRPADK